MLPFFLQVFVMKAQNPSLEKIKAAARPLINDRCLFYEKSAPISNRCLYRLSWLGSNPCRVLQDHVFTRIFDQRLPNKSSQFDDLRGWRLTQPLSNDTLLNEC